MKIKKILLINFSILVTLFIIFEFISYMTLYKKYENEIEAYNNISGNLSPKLLKINYSKVIIPDRNYLLDKNKLRPVEYRKGKPIILFGCSYTYGFGLNEDETFSRQLADYTDRTVINRGAIGSGIPFLYYQLNDKETLDSLPKDAEYIIYTLIPDHFPRLFRFRNFVLTGDHTLRYKIKNDKLVQDKPVFPFLHSLYTSIVLEEYFAEKKAQNLEKTKEYSLKLFNESYKIIKDNFKNAKFIILYIKCSSDYKYHTEDFFETIKDEIQNIDKNNIQIIEINKEIPSLADEDKYWISDNDHPSKEAWEKIIPILVKQAKIN